MILSNVSVPVLGMVDTAVVGHLDSPAYLGGVAIGTALFSFLFMGLNFLRMGTTGIAAQAYGADSGAAVRTALWQALVVAAALGLALILLQSPIAAAAWLALGPSDAVQPAAEAYFGYRIWGAPATLANYAIVGWFLGLQNGRVPLAIVLAINVTNIVLDLLLVTVLGMNAGGVGLASAIAETTGLAVGLTFVWRELRRWPDRAAPRRLTRWSAYRAFLGINGNIFLRTMALLATMTFITAWSARLGDTLLAANAILLNLQYLLSYGLDGLAHAAEALVGRARGARNWDALRRAVRLTLGWSLAVAVLFTAAFALGGDALIALLTDLPAVVATAERYLPWLILSPLVSVWSFVYDGVFVGATWARDMRNVMILGAAFVFVPAWWLTLPLGNHGLWLAFMLFMAARGVGMHACYRYRLVNEAAPAAA